MIWNVSKLDKLIEHRRLKKKRTFMIMPGLLTQVGTRATHIKSARKYAIVV